MKTIREIADKLGVDKQKVYRFIKQNHINEAVFDAVIEMLQKELELKNEQIRELNARLSEYSAALVAAQQPAQATPVLHTGTIQQHLTEAIDQAPERPKEAVGESAEKKGWFSRLFGGGER